MTARERLIQFEDVYDRENTSEMFLEAINKAEVFRCLAKPWMREHLIQTIKEAYSAFEIKLAYEEAHQALLETNQQLIDENIQLRRHQ